MIVLGLDTATSSAGIAIVDHTALRFRSAASPGGAGLVDHTALRFRSAASPGGAGLVDDHRVLAEGRHDTSGRAADLLVRIDELCRAAGVGPAALDAIAIGAGPGSFTGLRIGMATAKGIAFAAGRPLWAVSSLAALADDAARELAGQGLLVGDGGTICAVLDARRGEVYAGCFRRGVALAPERVMAPAGFAPWLDDLRASPLDGAAAIQVAGDAPIRFAGDAIDAHRATLASLAGEAGWLAARTPSGQAVARLALAGARVDVTLGGAPTYIRPSEAEVKYPDGVPGALPRR